MLFGLKSTLFMDKCKPDWIIADPPVKPKRSSCLKAFFFRTLSEGWIKYSSPRKVHFILLRYCILSQSHKISIPIILRTSTIRDTLIVPSLTEGTLWEPPHNGGYP